MTVPLTIAAPATAAALAYLNAKSGLGFDWTMISTAALGAFRMVRGQRRDTLNLFYVFEDNAKAAKTANKAFLWFEGQTWTYAESYDCILRYASWLRSSHGVKPGDIVAINFQNSQHFIFLWWALWSLGAKPAFINYNLVGKSLSHCAKAANTTLCVVDPELAANITAEVQADVPDTKFVIFTPEAVSEALASPPFRAPNPDRSQDEVSNMGLLIYTSGTTGLPKPAIVTWGKLIVGATFGHRLLNRGNDIMYTSMPLYHSAGSMLSVIPTVLSGSTQALGKRFSTKSFWSEVRASKATAIQYVGETLRYLLVAPPQIDPVTGENLDRKHHVKMAFGNGLRPDIWNKFKERFGVETIVEFYAATEATLALWNVSSNDYTMGAIGRSGWLCSLIFRNSMHIVELDWETELPKRDPKTGFCTKVQPGEPGELLFQLPADDIKKRFQGYYNNAKATNSKILRDVFTKGDAWFRTGDVIRGENRQLFFSDRIGDTFRWKSENVATSEVSEAVGRHPAVREANVYGVELPHHDGRAGCVAINIDGGAKPETLRSLAAHTKAALPKYAVPLFLRIVDEVGAGAQTTGTNKQQKHVLRQAGVKPGAVNDGSAVYWLKGETYVPFGQKEWRELESGRVKL